MEARRTARRKLIEWVRRYLPNELAGWVGELGGAATACVDGVRWSYRAQTGQRWPKRVLIANVLAIRSIAVEFGPAANLLARPCPRIEEVDSAPVAALATA